MLWTILLILLVMWALGLGFGVGGSLIHILLVVALVVLIVNPCSGTQSGLDQTTQDASVGELDGVRVSEAILNLGSDPSFARRSRLMKWAGTKNLGMLLLSIWLIATGLLSFFEVAFVHKDLVMAALAIAAGVLILLGR